MIDYCSSFDIIFSFRLIVRWNYNRRLFRVNLFIVINLFLFHLDEGRNKI